MNKIFLISVCIGILILISGVLVSSYICIYPQEDNPQVQEFKTKLNILALKNDIDNGLTQEVIYTKLKYFNPCKK